MPYISGVECRAEQRGLKQGIEQGIERGIEQGLRQGLLEGLALGLELKFGARARRLLSRLRRIEDVAQLQSLHQVLKKVNTLDDFRQASP